MKIILIQAIKIFKNKNAKMLKDIENRWEILKNESVSNCKNESFLEKVISTL